jgi:hypothetical protein
LFYVSDWKPCDADSCGFVYKPYKKNIVGTLSVVCRRFPKKRIIRGISLGWADSPGALPFFREIRCRTMPCKKSRNRITAGDAGLPVPAFHIGEAYRFHFNKQAINIYRNIKLLNSKKYLTYILIFNNTIIIYFNRSIDMNHDYMVYLVGKCKYLGSGRRGLCTCRGRGLYHLCMLKDSLSEVSDNRIGVRLSISVF